MTILAMDDSPVIQKLVALLLKPLGNLDLDMAKDLDEALAFIRQRRAGGQRHDLILTDLNCPGHPSHPATRDRGGLALAGLLRRDGRFRELHAAVGDVAPGYERVPILMFTSNPGGLDGFEPAPVDQVLVKGEYLKVDNQARFRDVIRLALAQQAAG